MIWKTGKLMVNLSVLVQKKTHLHLYPKILHITCKCKERRGRDCDNCDHNFSILGASFTDIVKNASVLSQCSDITYAGTASNCRLKYRLTMYMYTCKHSCVVHLLFAAPLHLGPGNNKDIDDSLCKARTYALQ